ncbi:MAG: Na/Pi cotransporter family protein [Clostridia bacterium]|nr:Na/Pi cotransporter family protein [Clostridia bacterium]
MNIFSLISLFGGLAFFLYGMDMMGKGLEKMAGGKLERILEGLTANKFIGVLLGAGVTAIIQSSSATTVMVVGFVNSGIMRLSQAIGVIMGANIGTTITAWILSLTGLSGDGLLVQLLKPSNFSPIFAVVGIILIMFTKKKKNHDIGTIMIGFAILMTGMDTMSAAVKPLAEMPEFTNILLLFSNPVFGVLAGAVLTAVIQSSSASVGILQALSATGSITFGAAVPIILGQNIGTCITALISCVGTKTNAKRAAVVHLYFNIIGTVLFLTLFYVLNAIIKFEFMNDSVNAVNIAVIHTLFNLITTSVLLPFTKQLEKLAHLTVKDTTEGGNEFALLDERFLQSPAFAVERCQVLVEKMAELSKNAILKALSLINDYNQNTIEEIGELEDRVDKYEDRIGDYLVKVASRDLSAEDSETVTLLLQSIGDFERISDHAVNVSESALELNEKNISFSEDALSEIKVLANAVEDIVNMAVKAFVKRDVELAKHVEPLEEVVDGLCREMRNRHIIRLQQGDCTIETGFVYNDLLTGIERVSDHCSNLAISVIQYDDDAVSHEFAHEIKLRGKLYKNMYSEYSDKYILPKNV